MNEFHGDGVAAGGDGADVHYRVTLYCAPNLLSLPSLRGR